MVGDTFMWFPDTKIYGETGDRYFEKKKAFEVTNFKFNMDNKESLDSEGSSGSGSKAGKAKFQDFEITKRVDTASMPLYKACSLATLFPSLMLACRRAGGSNVIYLQFIFRYVRVTGITWNGGEGGQLTTEVVTFNFKAMGAQYIPETSAGVADEGKRSSWSWNTITQGSSGTSTLDISGIAPPPAFLDGNPS